MKISKFSYFFPSMHCTTDAPNPQASTFKSTSLLYGSIERFLAKYVRHYNQQQYQRSHRGCIKKSAMMSTCFLTLIILLLQISFNSSTSISGITKLTPEESLVLTDGGNITSFARMTGTYLSGYFTYIEYTDATCSAVQYAESYPLTTCYPWIDGSSFISYANGTHMITNRFDDYYCKNQVNSRLSSATIQACDSDFRTAAVTTSYPTIKSSATLLSAA